ncbi:unnamed protein product [Rotaria socialis]
MQTSSRGGIRHHLVIWLDPNAHRSANYDKSCEFIRAIVNSIEAFSDPDKCIDFLTDRDDSDEQVVLILSETFSENIIPLIHAIPQLHYIYIHGTDIDQSKNVSWTSGYEKVRGQLWENLQSIGEQLKKDIIQCQNESEAISFVSASEIAAGNRQDPSFIYTQLLKEILLTNYLTDSEEEARCQMIEFCRRIYMNNAAELRVIDEFEREFFPEQSVHWYTRECFLHIMLNKALRSPEPDILYKFRYFLRHLNEQIRIIAAQQCISQKSITVFRGQGMPTDEFNKLKNGIGGLLSFRSFLSTSLDSEVAFAFAEPFKYISDQTSIVFLMNIDPSIKQYPFIHVDNMSYYQSSEQEILFTVGTVFRIDAVEKLKDDQWQVRLTSSNDIDMNLVQYMEYTRKRTRCSHPLIGLVKLADEMGQYKMIDRLAQIFTENDFPSQIPSVMNQMRHALGSAYLSAGNRTNALTHLQEALNIYLEYLPSDDQSLSSTYNNIGSVYHTSKDYEMALTYYQLALDCQLNSQDPDFDSSATYSMNLAAVYEALGRYDEVSACQKQALKFRQQNHGENDLTLLDMYSAIGRACYKKQDYAEAATYNEKALEIQEMTSSANPVSSINFLLSTGQICLSQGQYNDAIDYFMRALDLQTQYLLSNNPSFSKTYHNLGCAYYRQDKFAESIPYYQKRLDIELNSLADDHSAIASSYFNLSTAYAGILQYDEALQCARKAVEQLRKRPDPSTLELNQYITQIGIVLDKQNKYSEAIAYYQESIAVNISVVGDSNASLASDYYRIAETYVKLDNHLDALAFYQKALEIEQNTLADDHSSVAVTHFKISRAHMEMAQYDEALKHAHQAIEQLRKCSDLGIAALGPMILHAGYNLYQQNKCFEAVRYYEEALSLCVAYMPENDPQLATIYYRIASAYFELGNFTEALLYYQNTLENELLTLPSNAPTIATTYEHLAATLVCLRRFNEAIDAYLKGIDQLLKTHPLDHQDVNKLRIALETIMAQSIDNVQNDK